MNQNLPSIKTVDIENFAKALKVVMVAILGISTLFVLLFYCICYFIIIRQRQSKPKWKAVAQMVYVVFKPFEDEVYWLI